MVGLSIFCKWCITIHYQLLTMCKIFLKNSGKKCQEKLRAWEKPQQMSKWKKIYTYISYELLWKVNIFFHVFLNGFTKKWSSIFFDPISAHCETCSNNHYSNYVFTKTHSMMMRWFSKKNPKYSSFNAPVNYLNEWGVFQYLR